MPNRRLKIAIAAVSGVASLLLIGAILTVYLAPKQGFATVGTTGESEFVKPGSVPIGGSFTLVDHTGQAVTQDDFEGKYLLVFFGFTYCPDICPTTLGEIAKTMDLLGDDAGAVQPLFISVDPERDTPEVLAEYVAAFHPAIIGLTGTPEQTDAVANAYRLYYEKTSAEGEANSSSGADDDGSYTVNHQGNTYLMSPEGEYLRHFSYGTPPEDMAASIRRAIDEFGAPTTEGA
ncbi:MULTISPECIES: SCO family protein [Aurantimonadaceae]|uniref:Redoxin domain-containing protein n=1 Tax=Jiella pacifica TaxID=2696469 RepID=A0A6N9T9N5_9HYPH|nr:MULTISPECIES: SCO family protein [Aurantimonadaceae]MCK5932209.1 SCO family protein [Fulvimarina manganoxydans]NDW07971.1 redoxin domain-containing protein [Jiella pacifica]